MRCLIKKLMYNFAEKPVIKKGRHLTVFSSKQYDEKYFLRINNKLPDQEQFSFEFVQSPFNQKNAKLIPKESNTIICFVNDKLDSNGLRELKNAKVDLIALRCAGFNNVDLAEAENLGISVVRVPAYSPHAVAEHTIALAMALNRKIHKAYTRTRQNNFSLQGLIGYDLYKKTAGIIGLGKIGQEFAKICNGFGMKVLAHDNYVKNQAELEKNINLKFVDLPTLLKQSNLISLNCPLTAETKHIINKQTLSLVEKHTIIVNTGRGALIKTSDVIEALANKKLGGLALDVYEQEEGLFFEDHSTNIVKDGKLAYLLSFPNVLLTSHQAFLTNQALTQICSITLKNIEEFRQKGTCQNMVKRQKK